MTITMGFLPLLMLTELFEVLKKKIGLLRVSSEDHAEYQSQAIAVLSLIFEVITNTYVNLEMKESCGYIMLTITHPRHKLEIYDGIRRKRNRQGRAPAANHKPFFLGKLADDQKSDMSTMQMDEPVDGLNTNIQDGYFRKTVPPV